MVLWKFIRSWKEMEENMELTKKERELVEKSIEHWKEDVQKRLLDGMEIDSDGISLYWKGSHRIVECYGESCSLCIAYPHCKGCLYIRKHNIKCSNHAWGDFRNNPNLETCNNMIKALEEILE